DVLVEVVCGLQHDRRHEARENHVLQFVKAQVILQLTLEGFRVPFKAIRSVHVDAQEQQRRTIRLVTGEEFSPLSEYRSCRDGSGPSKSKGGHLQFPLAYVSRRLLPGA